MTVGVSEGLSFKTLSNDVSSILCNMYMLLSPCLVYTGFFLSSKITLGMVMLTSRWETGEEGFLHVQGQPGVGR